MSADPLSHIQLSHIQRWRRHLHANPELSLYEAETAGFVCRTLQELGIPFTAGVGGHGVVGTIARGGNRNVGLRADMDALPLTEATGLPWASRTAGVMHACGHDGHTASLLGAAALLAADPDWTGTVQLVFQPAEEGYGGARAMLADGLLERFPMERIFGYHNWPGLQAGVVALHAGPVMAAGHRFRLEVHGHAGHAAMPHATRDPVLAAAHLIVALQSVVSRTVDPVDAAVVSVCTMEAGVASNQIPGTATLTGTFRNHSAEVGGLVDASIRRVAAGVAATFGVEVEVTINTGVCATINRAAEADLAAAAAAGMGAAVRRDLPPSMASEDFGWYLQQRPGAFAWIGNGPAEGGRELHNPAYDFNDAILPVAAEWLAATARRALAAA
jgi:amidohydrolase